MLRRRRSSRRVPIRRLLRASDGTLTEVDGGAVVTLGELRDGLQAGRYFRVTRAGTDVDCTNEVLAELIREAVPDVDSSVLAIQNPLLRLLGGDFDARS